MSEGFAGSPAAGVGSRTICVGGGTGTGADGVVGVPALGEIMYEASIVLERILVPLPSDAVTAASTIVMGAVPLPFEVKVMRMTWIDAPDIP